MEWEDKLFEIQRDKYAKMADEAPEGSKKKEEYQNQVDELNYRLQNNQEYAQSIKEGPLNGYKAQAEALKSKKYENLDRVVSSGNTDNDTGEVTNLGSKGSEDGNGDSNSSPHDTNKPLRDALKMEQEKLFHDAKLSADSYTTSLDNLKTHEEIYGKTIASSNAELEVKQKRSLELAGLADTYTKKHDELAADTNGTIGETPELLDTIGVSQDEWNAKTKAQRNEIKEVNRELLQQNALIKAKFETELKYESSASDAQKESLKIANEVLKARLGDSQDVTKRLPKKLERISTGEKLDTLGLDRNSGMYNTEADRIKLEALRKKIAAYDEESKRLQQEIKDAEAYDKATKALNKTEEDKIETELKSLKIQTQTAEVLKKIADLTERLILLKQEDSASTAKVDEVTEAQKKSDIERKQTEEDYVDLKKKDINDLRKWEADSLIDMAQNGKSFKDIMKNVWSSIGKDAIYGLMGVQGQDSMWSNLFKGTKGKAGGKAGKKGNGGANATGGVVNVPSLAGENYKEEVIIPTEGDTSKSSALLAYTSKKLGLPQGGSEYTPYFKNQSLNSKPVVNVSIQQEESLKELQTANALMRQQNNLLLNTSQAGNTTIISTNVSQEAVLEVLAQNPDALQNILGRNKSNGWR
jgi:hypothetical protein